MKMEGSVQDIGFGTTMHFMVARSVENLQQQKMSVDGETGFYWIGEFAKDLDRAQEFKILITTASEQDQRSAQLLRPRN